MAGWVPRWFVVIEDGDGAGSPWAWRQVRRWLRPGRRHVSFLIELAPRAWLALDIHRNGVSSRGWEHTGLAAVEELVALGFVVLELDPNRPTPARTYWRGVTTCVSFAKMVAGLRAWWIVTPAQLEAALLRRGLAREVRCDGR